MGSDAGAGPEAEPDDVVAEALSKMANLARWVLKKSGSESFSLRHASANSQRKRRAENADWISVAPIPWPDAAILFVENNFF